MKKKNILIISIVLILIFSCIGMVGYKMSTPKPPKDVDAEVYKKSIEILAYTERCEKNGNYVMGENYLDYVNEIKEIYKQQNREETQTENEIVSNIAVLGNALFFYQEEHKQDSLDNYKDSLKKVKIALGLSPNQDSNKVWNRIKDK